MYLKQTYSGKYEMERPGSIFLTDDDIVKKLSDALAKDEANYLSPTMCVHYEVFLLRQIQTERLSILPYTGVSKPSCVPCSIYFDRLENVGFDPVSIRGSNGKVYPGWTFPSVESDKDPEDAERLRKLRTIVTDDLESLLWESIDALRRTARYSGTSVDDLPVSDLMDSERHRKNRSEEELSERSRLLGLRRKTRQRTTSLTTDNETGL
ncbi:hypothetical protein CC2G_002477 [Coprinopsis cinerea AmutBmut pab1-1]|nr:hypothetical protein CC2G_002477 [Coprinopsis cinerea AmutBmut pab1-1]